MIENYRNYSIIVFKNLNAISDPNKFQGISMKKTVYIIQLLKLLF